MLGHRPKKAARPQRSSRPVRSSSLQQWMPVLGIVMLFCLGLLGLSLFSSSLNKPELSADRPTTSEATRVPKPSAIAQPSQTAAPTLRPTAEEVLVSSSLDFAKPANPFEHETNNDFILTDPELETLALKLINEDRSAHGLALVAWNPVAAQAARLHAAHMVGLGFFSHWSPDGHGPQMRANRLGMQDLVMENIFFTSGYMELGQEGLIEVVGESQKGFMNSPGHRNTILTPYHTHVGVGMAYNPKNGDFYLAQEFVSDYIDLELLPYRAKIGDQFSLTGSIKHNVNNLLLNMTYMPSPANMSIDELNATGSYSDSFVFYEAVDIPINNAHFSLNLTLNNENHKGFYIVLLFMEIDGRMWPVIEHSIEVS
jgi:uncharacterized protein YkwD